MAIIIWEDDAEKMLFQLINWYKINGQINSAEKFRSNVISALQRISDHPQIGAMFSQLRDLKYTYRSLVIHKHNRIVYRVNEDTIYISYIWDCRRDFENIFTEE